MSKVVLSLKPLSKYADRPGEAYHFSRRQADYLPRVEAAFDELCLVYEPRRDGGRQSYVGWARIGATIPDINRAGYYFTEILNYAEFPFPVPFRNADNQTWELGLVRPDGALELAQSRASIREIPDHEFAKIVRAGHTPGSADAPTLLSPIGLNEPPILFDVDRPLTEQFSSRPVRDAAFQRRVRAAYGGRCAITGLSVQSPKSRELEMHASHIKPVLKSGPDVLQNGLALCRTVHWLFDEGLISLSDHFEILKSPKLPEAVHHRLQIPETAVNLPARIEDRPHPAFLNFHREFVFER